MYTQAGGDLRLSAGWRNLAVARGLEQGAELGIARAWFVLCGHDGNPDIDGHWREWLRILPNPAMAPFLPASEVVDAGEAEGFTGWAADGPRGCATVACLEGRSVTEIRGSHNWDQSGRGASSAARAQIRSGRPFSPVFGVKWPPRPGGRNGAGIARPWGLHGHPEAHSPTGAAGGDLQDQVRRLALLGDDAALVLPAGLRSDAQANQQVRRPPVRRSRRRSGGVPTAPPPWAVPPHPLGPGLHTRRRSGGFPGDRGPVPTAAPAGSDRGPFRKPVPI